MSESERLRRKEYKRNRRKWILIQTVALILALVVSAGMFLIYNKMSSIYYIEYTERGDADYRVQLKDNGFFDDDYVDKGHSYVAELIKDISADFQYDLNMGSSRVNFDYSYKIDALLTISNKDSGDPIIAPVYELVPEKKTSLENGGKLSVGESVTIDYNKYNAFAEEFVKTYDLKEASCLLTVTMYVDVLSHCEDFENNSVNSYWVSVNIPLNVANFSIYTSSVSPSGENRVLACSSALNKDVILTVSASAGALALILAVSLLIYTVATRNDDINYTNRIKKILSSYRSFIQQIEGEFDFEGYQIVRVKTFGEMLNIRDTLQSPILMFENLDQTKTDFIITTSTRIVYTFEIKVDNYDELYGITTETEGIIVD